MYERYGGGTSLVTSGSDRWERGLRRGLPRRLPRRQARLLPHGRGPRVGRHRPDPGRLLGQRARHGHGAAQRDARPCAGLRVHRDRTRARELQLRAVGFGPTTFSLDDDPDPTLADQEVFGQVTPGVGYSVSQAVPAGWDLTARHATTAARSGTSTWTPVRRSTARSPTRSAAAWWWSSTRCRTTPRTSRSPPAAGSTPTSFSLDDDSDGTLPNTAHAQRRADRQPATRCRSRRARRAGTRGAPPAATAARSATSTWARTRRSPAPSRTTSAARSWSSRTRSPTTPQDFSFTAGGGLTPSELHRSTTTPTGRFRTRRRSANVAAGAGLLAVARPCPAGWSQASAHLQRRQPRRRTSASRRRDRHVHVHQQPAAAGSSPSRTPSPNDAQDFSFTAGGGLSPTQLPARRRLRPDTVQHAHVRRPRPGRGYSLSETVPSGWDQIERDLRRRQPGIEHQRRLPARRSPARSRTQARRRSWS